MDQEELMNKIMDRDANAQFAYRVGLEIGERWTGLCEPPSEMLQQIRAYNADAERPETALNAAESEFRWRVQGWGPERELELVGFDGCENEDEIRRAATETLRVKALTKKRYERGRAEITQDVCRDKLNECADDMIWVLIHLAQTELERSLSE